MSDCECKFCEKTKLVDKAISERNVDNLISLLESIYTDLIHVEDDLNYYKSILDGSWPSSVEQLTRALEKAKKYETERAL